MSILLDEGPKHVGASVSPLCWHIDAVMIQAVVESRWLTHEPSALQQLIAGSGLGAKGDTLILSGTLLLSLLGL